MGCSIAIASGKGGTGKSIISSNLSVVLAKAGKNVLILDADIKMANLSLLLDLEYADNTLNEVLSGEADLEDAIYEKYGVKILPAGISLSKTRKAKLDKLEEVFKEITQNTDYLIIDTPPGLEVDAISALAGAENALLVVNPEISCIADVFKIKKVSDLLNTNVLGLIVNRVRYDVSELSVKEIEAILESKAVGIIPEDQEVKKSVAFGVPFYIRSPDSIASKAIYRLGMNILGKKENITESKNSYERLLRILR